MLFVFGNIMLMDEKYLCYEDPNCIPSGRLEEITRPSSDYMVENSPSDHKSHNLTLPTKVNLA